LIHTSGGLPALFVGPWQFWTGLRRTVPRIHRWTGRLFLLGVAVGVTGAALPGGDDDVWLGLDVQVGSLGLLRGDGVLCDQAG
jgi:hypothetical protein